PQSLVYSCCGERKSIDDSADVERARLECSILLGLVMCWTPERFPGAARVRRGRPHSPLESLRNPSTQQTQQFGTPLPGSCNVMRLMYCLSLRSGSIIQRFGKRCPS